MSSAGLKWLKAGIILTIIVKNDEETVQQLEQQAGIWQS